MFIWLLNLLLSNSSIKALSSLFCCWSPSSGTLALLASFVSRQPPAFPRHHSVGGSLLHFRSFLPHAVSGFLLFSYAAAWSVRCRATQRRNNTAGGGRTHVSGRSRDFLLVRFALIIVCASLFSPKTFRAFPTVLTSRRRSRPFHFAEKARSIPVHFLRRLLQQLFLLFIICLRRDLSPHGFASTFDTIWTYQGSTIRLSVSRGCFVGFSVLFYCCIVFLYTFV